MINNKNIIKEGDFFSGIGSPEKTLEFLKSDKVITDYECKFFVPTDKNFTLKNIHDINLEDKIIKLGFLLNQVKDINKII